MDHRAWGFIEDDAFRAWVGGFCHRTCSGVRFGIGHAGPFFDAHGRLASFHKPTVQGAMACAAFLAEYSQRSVAIAEKDSFPDALRVAIVGVFCRVCLGSREIWYPQDAVKETQTPPGGQLLSVKLL